MEAVSAFFMRNIVYVYFFYGLAFFAMGVVVLLESGRTSEFRFPVRCCARAVRPGARHARVVRMFQIFATHETQNPAEIAADIFRIVTLVLSFLLLLDFGARLLPGAEDRPRPSLAGGRAGRAVAGGRRIHRLAQSTQLHRTVSAADVLARYSLAIPGALLAAWALLHKRRDFHARDVGLRAGPAMGRAGLLRLRPGAGLHPTEPRLPLADDQHGVFPAHVRHPGAASSRAGGSRHRYHPGPRAAGIRAGGAGTDWRTPTRHASRRRPPPWTPTNAAPAR